MKGLLFTFVLTYGGAAVSLFNPFRGLLVYVCFAIIKPDAMWPWSVPAGSYSRIVAGAMLLGWLASGCGNLHLGRSKPIVTTLLAFWLWTIFGALNAANQVLAWEFVEALTKVVLPFLVGITTIDSVSKLKQLAWVIVVSQGYVALEMNLDYFRGFNTLQQVGFAGLDNNSAAIALVTALGLAFFLGLHVKKMWQKGIAWGMAAFMGHAILFSLSRGAMLATLISGCAAFVLIPKRPQHYFGFAIAAFIGLMAAGDGVRERFMTTFGQEDGEREASAQSRLDLWADCWDVMQRKPLLGVGPNHWPLIAADYGWPEGKEAHSLWMQTGAELGIPGLLLLLSFYGLVIHRLWPVARADCDAEEPWFRDSACMVITSLLGFAVAAQFVSLEALETPYYVVLLGAAGLRVSSIAQLESEFAIDEWADEETDELEWSDGEEDFEDADWSVDNHPQLT